MKSTLKYLSGVIFLLLLLITCSKMDNTYSEFLLGGEKVYSAKPKKTHFYPGNKRIKVKIAYVSAPNIEKVKIFWNGRNEFTEWEIKPDLNNDTTYVEGIINPIKEGRHTFEFVTYDKAGNHSIEFDTVGVVYGDDYEASLRNRALGSAVLKGGQVELKWLEMPYKNGIKSEVFYKNMEGKTTVVNVPLNEFVTHIAARPIDDSIRFRTVYIPEAGAIDTFYAPIQSIILTPPVPEFLDKSKFKALILPTDAKSYLDFKIENMWNNDLTGNSWYGTADQSGTPHWFTFDLGVSAKLTEYTIWQRGIISTVSLVYAHANMKNWELWGSNDPDPSGSWDSWVKLIECESFKPSGLPFGQVSPIDIEYAKKGDTFTFPENSPSVRYIRIKMLETWETARSHRSFLQEISFKGIIN